MMFYLLNHSTWYSSVIVGSVHVKSHYSLLLVSQLPKVYERYLLT